MQTLAAKYLAQAQRPDGGWGYRAGETSSVEVTAAVIMTLRNDPSAASYRRALDWLASAQHSDGGWGIVVADRESCWQTAWALLVLAKVDRSISDRAATWLLGVETPEPAEDAMQNVQPLLGIDLTLRGWPWQPKQPTWVEPTALAMLALAAVGHQKASRVQQAVRFLADRRCQGGGWNVGNPVMFSQPLPARAHPTAWALLALARVAPSEVQPEDIRALRLALAEDGGALALAWGLLVLQVLGQTDSTMVNRLSALQLLDGSWDTNSYHTAIAVLATEGVVL